MVDAWAAQQADADTKPITLAFALAGLYLHVEKGLTGRQVQQMHMLMAKRQRDWPRFVLPEKRGDITVEWVMSHLPGPGRDRAINEWCCSVWEVFRSNRDAVIELLRICGIEG